MADNAEVYRSETSGVRVRIYSHQNDPILLAPAGYDFLKGTKGQYDTFPLLVGASTTNALGGGGTFSLDCKPPKASEPDIFDRIIDDDWVDISFTRFGLEWHVMRGLVKDVRRRRAVSSDGATGTVYTISGIDFTGVWQSTLMWFDMVTQEVIGDEAIYRITNGNFFDGRTPEEMVRAILVNAYNLQAKFGRANFAPPRSVPGAATSPDTKFLNMVTLNVDGFTNTPARKATNASCVANPTGINLWALAQQWCDPMFCELFTDVYNDGKPAEVKNGIGVPQPVGANSRMTVVFRDKPFPVVDTRFGSGDLPGYAPGKRSPWFQLPLYVVPRGQIATGEDIGRSGAERFNAFFAVPSQAQEGMGTHYDLIAPLWDPEDIHRHGMRHLDVSTSYRSDKKLNLTISNDQRYLLSNWYAINPYLYSGTLPLVLGRPDIRVGGRVRIPDSTGRKRDETFYVEKVSNSWSHGPGVKTTLGVTRGFIGTDEQLLAAINKTVSNYVVSGPAIAGADDAGTAGGTVA